MERLGFASGWLSGVGLGLETKLNIVFFCCLAFEAYSIRRLIIQVWFSVGVGLSIWRSCGPLIRIHKGGGRVGG